MKKIFEETKYNRCRLDEKLWYYKAMNYCYWKGIISNVADAPYKSFFNRLRNVFMLSLVVSLNL